MDDADRAQPNIEAAITDGMAKVRREMESHLPSTGFCYWCESPVSAGRVFCSKECHTDFEHERQRRKDLGL